MVTVCSPAAFAQAGASDAGGAGVSASSPIPMPAGQAPVMKDPFQIAAPLAPLSTVANNIELTALSAAAPVKGLVCIKIIVRNNTDRPLSFEGDQASITLGTLNLAAAPMVEIEKRIKQPDNPHGYAARSLENTVTAAVTVGAVQTVDGQRRLKGPIQQRYGWDNIRRIDRQTLFAKRILWPGDSTEGSLYFVGSSYLSGAALKIPVSAFYDKADKHLITVTVK